MPAVVRPRAYLVGAVQVRSGQTFSGLKLNGTAPP